MDGGPSEVFSKINPSFLTLKEGSTSLSKPLPSQKGKDVLTAPPCRSEPLRYKVGGPSEVYASSGAAVFVRG